MKVRSICVEIDGRILTFGLEKTAIGLDFWREEEGSLRKVFFSSWDHTFKEAATFILGEKADSPSVGDMARLLTQFFWDEVTDYKKKFREELAVVPPAKKCTCPDPKTVTVADCRKKCPVHKGRWIPKGSKKLRHDAVDLAGELHEAGFSTRIRRHRDGRFVVYVLEGGAK